MVFIKMMPMKSKSGNLLEKALNLSPNARAAIAHCLIQRLDEPSDLNHEKAWLGIAKKRWAEIEMGEAKTVKWSVIKNSLLKKHET